MFELGRMPWRLEIYFPSFLQKRSLLMRKTSRIWRAPARGLQRVRMARLLAVVVAVVMVVVLAVDTAVLLAVVTTVLLAVVTAVVLSEVTSVLLFVATAVVLAVVMAEVWLSGVEAKLEDFSGGETKIKQFYQPFVWRWALEKEAKDWQDGSAGKDHLSLSSISHKGGRRELI